MKPQAFAKLHDDPIHFCIIGHTDHGKTSTIRTLTHDESIGIVVDGPDTTPGVVPYPVKKIGKTRYWVYDTAGFSAFGRRMLDCEEEIGHRPEIHEFVDFLEGITDEQAEEMAGSLRKVMECHVAIVVVNASESCTKADYLEEIDFLRTSGTPIIISLNFLHSSKSKPAEWRKQLIKLRVTNIINFDAHKRTMRDERNLFVSLEALLESQLHKDFIEHWIDDRERISQERDLRVVESIKRAILAMSGLSVSKINLHSGNFKKAQKEATEEFAETLSACFWRSVVEVLGDYDVEEKHVELANGGKRGAATSRQEARSRWRPSLFKAGTSGGAAATVAAIEAMMGGVTLFIPTGLTFLLTYGGAQMAEVKKSPEGTALSLSISDEQLIQLIGCLVDQARRARTLGRGAFSNERDPNPVVPFQVEAKSDTVEKGEIRDSVLHFARTRPKRSETFDEDLLEVLRH